jgi:hypothetical protein
VVKPCLEGNIMNNTAPTDSVLRRHYETTRSCEKDDSNKRSRERNRRGGFMSWLKRLIGG